MPLNPDAVGAVGDPRTISWTSKDALLYAVGIGAGQADLPPKGPIAPEKPQFLLVHHTASGNNYANARDVIRSVYGYHLSLIHISEPTRPY